MYKIETLIDYEEEKKDSEYLSFTIDLNNREHAVRRAIKKAETWVTPNQNYKIKIHKIEEIENASN